MKILLICGAFAPVVTGHSERAVALARMWKKAGYRTTVIALDTNQHKSADDYIPSDLVDEHILVRTGLLRVLKQSGRLRFVRGLHHLFFSAPGPYRGEVWKAWRAVKQLDLSEFDLVWVTSPPHDLQLIGYWLNKQSNLPYVMDLRDPWGDSRRIRWSTPIHRQLARLWHRRCATAASSIVVNTPGDLRSIANFDAGNAHKVTCIPNGFFESDYLAGENSSRWRTNSPYCLTYAGSSYGGRAEAGMMRLAQKFSDRGLQMEVRVLGASKGPYPFAYCGLVPPSEVAAAVRNSRWLFLYMPEDAIDGEVISLKAYLYARSGKPVVYQGPVNATFKYLSARTTVVRLDDSGVVEHLLRATESAPRPNGHYEGSWENRYADILKVMSGNQGDWSGHDDLR